MAIMQAATVLTAFLRRRMQKTGTSTSTPSRAARPGVAQELLQLQRELHDEPLLVPSLGPGRY